MRTTGDENPALVEVRSAWSQLVASGARTALPRGMLRPLDLPYYLGPGTEDEPLNVDVDADTTISFTAAGVARLEAAATRWTCSGLTVGRVDGYEVLQDLLMSAAATVASGADRDAALDAVLARRWASVVAVPLGGAFLVDGPVQIGPRAVTGHVDRDTERAVADLALRWHRPLGGFQFNDEAWWTEDFLAAEQDGHLAVELEARMIEERGWTPMVLAVALDTAGQRADIEALAAAQAFAGALYLLAGLEKDTAARMPNGQMPWVLDFDGPNVAFFVDDDAGPGPSPLRVDTLGGSRGNPLVSPLLTSRSPIDVRAILESGFEPALTAVINSVLDSQVNDDHNRMARACQLIGPVARHLVCPLGVAAAATAAALVSPNWEERRRLALAETDLLAGLATIQDAVSVLRTAMLGLM
jgi:hypothetical protein